LESALLVVRWQRGDRSAFDGLVKLWEQPLYYYLRRLASTDADAEELLQETWLKLFKSLNQIQDPHTLPAYLYKTARHAAISRMRRRDFEKESYSEDIHHETVYNEIATFDDAEQVHHALDQLPLPQREAITLYFLQDLTLEEISQVLGVPLGTVKSRLHYAKLAIRKILISGEMHD
jgi:RNA polymerase sigma-70 factor (ECF subfamily)